MVYGEPFDLSTLKFTKTGYKLIGYTGFINGKKVTYAPNAVVKNLMSEELSSGVILTAVWGDPNYTITYDLNGGKTTDKSVSTKVAYSYEETSQKIALLNYALNAQGNYVIVDEAQQKIYVRVRKLMKDSTGADVAGAWSSTVRASKKAN